MAVRARCVVHRGNPQVMDHPPLVPAALVVNNEKPGDVGEDVDERLDVVGVGRQTRLGLQNHAYGAEGGQTAIGSSRGEHGGVVDSRYQAGERIGLEAGCVKQVILEELAGLGLEWRFVKLSFRVGLCG